MNYLFQAKQLIIACILLPVLTNGQTLLDIELGTNNVSITEIQFEYDGNTVTQTAGVTTNTEAVDRAIVNYMEIDDGGTQTILYPNNYGSIVVNNNFTAAVGGVGVYSDGAFILASNATTWEPAMEEVVNSSDLMEFLYYDGTSNLPGGDDFDILFAKGLQTDDYVVVGERNGNTYFTVTPLGADGNPITAGRKLRFGFQNGTNSGNGTDKYDWDIGLSPSNYTDQSMHFTVVDASLFDTGGLPVYGFRVDNNGEADVKFFGLSENSYENNPNNPLVGGLTGNVFNDDNALVDNTVDGPGIDSADASQLYAILYDNTTSTVEDTVSVSADGSFEFLNLDANSDYGVAISINNGVPGAALPEIELPADWIYTGDKLGTGTGSDGTADGDQFGIAVTTTLVTNVNFGIEKLPTADDYTYTIPDPILNSYMQIGLAAKSGLTGADEEDGLFNDGEKFGITSLPTNGNELYYDGNQITVGADGLNPLSESNPFVINNYDETLLQIRFTGNGSTTTTFEYVTIDAAGEQPATPATYTMNYSAVVSGSLSGTVFNDADGLTDNTVDGTGIDDPETTQLYANLYNATSDEVIATVAIGTDGTYLFENLIPNPNLGVVISTTEGVVGETQPAAALPTDWINTGEFRGTGAGNDGTVDGIQTGITVGTTLVPNVNFGIEKTPTADPHTHDLGTVSLDSVWNVGVGFTNNLSGTDEEDGVLSTSDKLGITDLPTNGNELYYNDVLIEFGQDGTNPPSETNPFIIDNYNPLLLDIKFTGANTSSSVFKYIVIDAADEASPEVDYTVTYNEIQVGSLSGNVFQDADGYTDSTVDGTGINLPEATQLYAVLYDNNISVVLDTMPIANDGTYFFDNLPAYGDYGVAITTVNGTIGGAVPSVELPADWVYTGDQLGTGTGNDGTTDGEQFGLVVTNTLLPNVNFGIQKIPDADDYTFGIADPVPDSYFTIGSGATADLSGNDLEDGTVGTNDRFAITSLPTSGNEIYYDGVEITVGTDGLNPPSAANPFVIANYDPTLLEIRFTGGPQTATEFNYATIDAAGFQSADATYELTYSALPVEWAAFNVQRIGESGRIYFATASESKSSHFFVQKSLDGKNFRNIQTMEAQGTTTSYTEYEYVDRVLNLGTNYYRIAQIDFDGTIDYTEIKSIVFNADHTTLVYPNPVHVGQSVNIKYYSGEEAVQVVVSDMLGHEVIKTPITNPAGWNETNVDVSDLPGGVYALRVGNRQQAVIFTIAE